MWRNMQVKDKIIQRAIKGLPNGGIAPFGYKWQDKRYILDQEHSEIIKFIYNTYIQTQSLSETRKTTTLKLGKSIKQLTNKSFFTRILRNPVYIGDIISNGKSYKGQHEPIIARDVFNLAQSIHKEPHKHPSFHVNLPFTGIIKCSECGSIMTSSHAIKHIDLSLIHIYEPTRPY